MSKYTDVISFNENYDILCLDNIQDHNDKYEHLPESSAEHVCFKTKL